MSPAPQSAILNATVPRLGRFLTFDLRAAASARAVLTQLREADLGALSAVGIGTPLAAALGANVGGLRPFPAIEGKGCSFPSTQGAVWIFIGGDEPWQVHDAALALCRRTHDMLSLTEEVLSFRYRDGRDLTGYEDGTENPKADAAVRAAIVAGRGAGLDGSSFVAGQRWVHDLESFAKLPQPKQDATFGRRRSDNVEMDDAPPTAHVKRAAQESFDPPAFMVRRSMPWGGAAEHGLYFVAYGGSLDAFEHVLRRMAGTEDGITDALTTFSKATSGGYYWCAPLRDGKLDWSALGV